MVHEYAFIVPGLWKIQFVSTLTCYVELRLGDLGWLVVGELDVMVFPLGR